MRFNPKADISRGRVRDVGGSDGGGGPMRLPLPGGSKAGGGLGVVLVILLFVLLSQCSGIGGMPIDTGSTQQGTPEGLDQDGDRYANCETGADAQQDADCARMAVVASLEDYWAATLPEQGRTSFEPSQVITFTGAVSTGCGQAGSQVGPFYCPADQQVYLDTTFFRDVLENQLGGQGGDFVEPYVLAHEYGHHVQNLMGTMGQVRTQRGPDSDAVRLELQADCYAGMWARDASDGDSIFLELTEQDIAEAVDAAKTVGDDRIQQQSGGRVNPEGWTHGSSQQRMEWFMVGFEEGSLQACDTFSASSL